jgi:diguanylate cyclase (GGDEF)-like protein
MTTGKEKIATEEVANSTLSEKIESLANRSAIEKFVLIKFAELEAEAAGDTEKAAARKRELQQLARMMYREAFRSQFVRYPERNLVPEIERLLDLENEDLAVISEVVADRESMQAEAYERAKQRTIRMVVQKCTLIAENKIIKMEAVTDELTGLNTRKYLESIMIDHFTERDTFEKIKNGEDIQGAMIMVDIDHFKSVNDALGHKSGDNALVEFSRFLRDAFREDDYVARWGGEEFAVFLPAIDKHDRQKVDPQENLQKILQRVYQKASEFRYTDQDGKVRQLTFSLGAKIFDYKEMLNLAEQSTRKNLDEKLVCESIATASRGADEALYSAKHEGRNRAYLSRKNEAGELTNCIIAQGEGPVIKTEK